MGRFKTEIITDLLVSFSDLLFMHDDDWESLLIGWLGTKVHDEDEGDDNDEDKECQSEDFLSELMNWDC